ncbi:hypothetical protein KAR91_17890 [Candidatus Pacearchaeota archaeon]|nr:hypothetical protein [Candidatus Pacearchaeota archaeon]
MEPKWYNVNQDIRVYSGHADSAQKQGWILAPAAILAIDEYKGSFQFEEAKVPEGAKPEDFLKFAAKPGYPQLWVRSDEVSLEPYDPSPEPDPDPVPDPDPLPVPEPIPSDPGDAELGRAFRIVANFIRKELLGR